MGTGCAEPGRITTLFERFKERTGYHPTGKGGYTEYRSGKATRITEKVIFAGDSAGQVMPLTYEGIYYAMKAGEFVLGVTEEKWKTISGCGKRGFKRDSCSWINSGTIF
jgi:geranylgeranyl reductase